MNRLPIRSRARDSRMRTDQPDPRSRVAISGPSNPSIARSSSLRSSGSSRDSPWRRRSRRSVESLGPERRSSGSKAGTSDGGSQASWPQFAAMANSHDLKRRPGWKFVRNR